jgi:HEAT repeats
MKGVPVAAVAIAVLVAIVLGVGLVHFQRPGEPVYGGKRATEWLEQYDENARRFDGGGEKARQARDAILGIGTNGLPTYLELLKAKESPAKVKLLKLVPDSWLSRFHVTTLDGYRVQVNRGAWLGIVAVEVLGGEAKTAVPDLGALLRAKERYMRANALAALAVMGPAARDALPEMLGCLRDPDQLVRRLAAQSLSAMRQDPERALPALLAVVEDYRTNRLDAAGASTAIWSLGTFREQAKAAVPTLRELLNDPDAHIESAARDALKTIEPEGEGGGR